MAPSGYPYFRNTPTFKRVSTYGEQGGGDLAEVCVGARQTSLLASFVGSFLVAWLLGYLLCRVVIRTLEEQFM